LDWIAGVFLGPSNLNFAGLDGLKTSPVVGPQDLRGMLMKAGLLMWADSKEQQRQRSSSFYRLGFFG